MVLLEQFFYPDGWGGAEIPRDLAVHLARSGWRVDVICGTEQYAPVAGSVGADPRAEGVNIRRVPALPMGRDVRKCKALRQAWFCGWAALRLFLRRPPDVFVSQTNPPPAIPLVALAARIWRKPFILIAMDLYPEVLLEHGTIARGGMLARVATAVFGWAYRSASVVVALGPSMADRIRAKGVPEGKVVEIGNWATGDLGVIRGSANRLRTDLDLGDCFVLVYSGNLGVGHEFETLLRGVAIACEQVPTIRIVFFGSGARLSEVRQLVQDLGLEHRVNFGPVVPAERLPETLGLADLGVVTLRKGFEGLMVPSKLLGYMARGIPVLYVGPPSDASVLVSRHGCGLCVGSGESAAVARTIVEAYGNREKLTAMGRAGQQAYEAGMTRDQALSSYDDVLRRCLDAGRG